MSFYNGIDKKISKMKDQTVKRTKDMSETLQISVALKSEEEQQRELFQEIGRMCFDKGILQDVTEVQEQYKAVMEGREKIRQYKERLLVLKGSVTCPVCGNEVKIDQKFCPQCGKNMEEIDWSEITEEENEGTSAFTVQEIAADKGPLFKLMIAAGGLQLLSAVLWFVGFVSINAFGAEFVSLSAHFIYAESDAVFLSFITVLLCLAAAAKTVYSLIYTASGHGFKVRFQIGVAIWYILLVGFAWIATVTSVHSDELGGLASLGITFGGWLCLLDCIALLTVLLKISKKIKTSRYKEINI